MVIITVIQPAYGLQTKHKMRTRLAISGSSMYGNLQTWLELQAKQKIHIDFLIMTVC